MSVLFPSQGSPTAFYQVLTGTSATAVAGSDDNPVWVYWFEANEYNGSTPNLTLDLYDGSTAYYIGIGGSTWVAKALTAKQSLLFSEGLMIPKTWRLRATSSAANQVQIVGQMGIVRNT